MKTFKQLLEELDACSDAVQWAGDMPVEEVVATCHRGDWLLWLAAKVGVDNHKIILAAGLCANMVRDKMEDKRSTDAVDACIAYGEGRIERQAVIAAAYTAAYTAYTADVTYIANICREVFGEELVELVNKKL